ncbi:hypothetical protein CHS0354_038703 [Potamilus streckersoni]|uniref:Uncharacterized protein n=1 Tax=Potamilus streckersoni TaxID=2493646 RepID=A0AAE0SFA0_9BIVA|nr:hypothetical protein CHS0354_038703 [Potamilus streckersoni]
MSDQKWEQTSQTQPVSVTQILATRLLPPPLRIITPPSASNPKAEVQQSESEAIYNLQEHQQKQHCMFDIGEILATRAETTESTATEVTNQPTPKRHQSISNITQMNEDMKN